MILFLPLCPALTALNIEEAVQMALKEHPELLEYELENRRAHWAMVSRFRDFFPELGLSYSRSDSVVTGEADARLRQWSFTVNQLIFSGGRQLGSLRSARRELHMRDLHSADMRLTAAYQVALSYAEVLKNREILKIRESYCALLKEQAALAALERELGLLTSHELLDIRIHCREYDLELREAQEALRESRAGLALLLSLSPEELPPLSGTLNTGYRARSGILSGISGSPSPSQTQGISPERVDHNRLVERLKERAKNRNREILKLVAGEESARQTLQDARLGWLPRIEAEGVYSLSGSRRVNEEASFSLGLNFIFDTPLFPGAVELQAGKSSPDERNRAFSAEGDILQNLEKIYEPRDAQFRLYLAGLQRQALVRQVCSRVKDLVASIILNRERLEIIGEKILLESEKLKIEEIRMKQGEMTRLDYVESEIRLADYKTNRIEGVTELYAREKELEQLCGEFPSIRENGLILYPEGEE